MKKGFALAALIAACLSKTLGTLLRRPNVYTLVLVEKAVVIIQSSFKLRETNALHGKFGLQSDGATKGCLGIAVFSTKAIKLSQLMERSSALSKANTTDERIRSWAGFTSGMPGRGQAAPGLTPGGRAVRSLAFHHRRPASGPSSDCIA